MGHLNGFNPSSTLRSLLRDRGRQVPVPLPNTAVSSALGGAVREGAGGPAPGGRGAQWWVEVGSMGNHQGVFWREDKSRSIPAKPAAPHPCRCFASNCRADKLFLACGGLDGLIKFH